MAECDHLELLTSENEERVGKVKQFLEAGCGCSRGIKGSHCSLQFSKAVVLENLNNCMELSHGELDLAILANIQASTFIEISGEKRKRSTRCSLTFQGRTICKEMFLILYGISYSRFLRLKDHYGENGLSLRVHGNHKRLPHNATPQAVSEDVKNFLTNYVEENATLLPGRIPGFKNDDIKLLSSSDTKMSVWRDFKKSCEETGKQGVCYTKFINLWQQFHPNVVVAKPMSDLCLTCQQKTCKLVRSANLPDREKSPTEPSQPAHISNSSTPVTEDLVRSCVTPRKVQRVRETLQSETDQYKCAIKLLPDFFTPAELAMSNTDGNFGKQPLDKTKSIL